MGYEQARKSRRQADAFAEGAAPASAEKIVGAR